MELNYVSVSLLLSINTLKNVFLVTMATHVGMLVEYNVNCIMSCGRQNVPTHQNKVTAHQRQACPDSSRIMTLELVVDID